MPLDHFFARHSRHFVEVACRPLMIGIEMARKREAGRAVCGARFGKHLQHTQISEMDQFGSGFGVRN
jgi:hypothetical protein